MTNQTQKSHTSALAVRRLLPFLFYLLIAIFLFFYLKKLDFSRLSSLRPEWLYIGAATATGLTSRFFGAYIWRFILKRLGATAMDTGQLIYVYAKSWLGRYIPGAAPWILSRIYFANQHGISKNKLGVSSLLEASLKVAVTLFIALLWLSIDYRFNVVGADMKLIMLAVLTICIIVIMPPVFNRIVSAIYKIVRKKKLPSRDLADGSIVTAGAGFYAVAALLDGLSLFFIVKAVYPELDFGSTLFVMGVGNLAGSLGMLAVFAPSGIGVRESIQLVLLSLIMPAELALVATIVTRLWIVVIDFLFFGLGKLVAELLDQSKAAPPRH